MPLRIALGLMLASATSAALAADLAAEGRLSRLGAVFAAPAAGRVIVIDDGPRLPAIVLSPRLPGYYGRAGDFAYRNYYGTSPVAIFSRLPYACGHYGYC